MENKLWNRLLIIASVGVAIAALIFILTSIFNKTEYEWALPAGLFCSILSGLFNIIRFRFAAKK